MMKKKLAPSNHGDILASLVDLIREQSAQLEEQRQQMRELKNCLVAMTEGPLSSASVPPKTLNLPEKVVSINDEEKEIVAPPSKVAKKQVQPSIFAGFGLTSSQTSANGASKISTPDTVDVEQKIYSCAICKSTFTNAGNLKLHTQACETRLEERVEAAQDKVDLRMNNRGAQARRTYTARDKFRALLFYESFAGDGSVISAASQEFGISVPTIAKWLSTESARATIRANFLHKPNDVRGGKKRKRGERDGESEEREGTVGESD